MKTEIANGIKYRKHANDEFFTPQELADKCLRLVPIVAGDVVMDNAPSNPAFYNAISSVPGVVRVKSSDFFIVKPGIVDWCVTNPPYSKLDDWFLHSTKTCRKGFAYLLGLHNITPRRIELCENEDFGLTTIHLCKVFRWFGISAFCVFEKGVPSVIKYDRTVWHSDNESGRP